MEVILICGISGAGKSSWVEVNAPDAVVVSADTFFQGPDGVYRFDPFLLGEAHRQCLRAFIHALYLDRVNQVVVDNTNVMIRDIQTYHAIALAAGAVVRMVILEADPYVATERSLHKVSLKANIKFTGRLRNMIQNIPREWNITPEIVVTT